MCEFRFYTLDVLHWYVVKFFVLNNVFVVHHHSTMITQLCKFSYSYSFNLASPHGDIVHHTLWIYWTKQQIIGQGEVWNEPLDSLITNLFHYRSNFNVAQLRSFDGIMLKNKLLMHDGTIITWPTQRNTKPYFLLSHSCHPFCKSLRNYQWKSTSLASPFYFHSLLQLFFQC